MKITQSAVIREAILKCLDEGMKDKSKIFTRVVDKLDVPRPTVRRVCGDLKMELMDKVEILSEGIPQSY